MMIIIDGEIDWIVCPKCGSKVFGSGICFSCGNNNLSDFNNQQPKGEKQHE